MFFHFQIFIFSLIFWTILKFFASDYAGEFLWTMSEKSYWLMAIFFAFLFAYFFDIAKRISRKINMTSMPVLFVASSLGMLYFVRTQKQENLLIILLSAVYYFIHLAYYRLRSCKTDKTSLGILAAGSLATIFIFYSVSYGIYLNFAIDLWVLMVSLALATSLISFQYFILINDDKNKVMNYSFVLGLAMAEIVWMLNFWPFGYLTTGVINLIFYYVLWDMVHSHFRDELTKRRIAVNMVFFGLLIAMVLTSTRWMPVV